ncbi:hypothetical protein [Tianweitania sediminis]|uniref:Uncharacterized protein n=1 Tax=Tianweitania sediminis TaxID=1502156 RepID=A0A8J7R5W3_9HYPH|nr:hypothetical protein [Tianweitania sediminis]MBP0438402.1 hypothetical protein [Tianweitania sediminis]
MTDNPTLKIDTLGRLKEHGYRIGISCGPCNRFKVADMDALIARKGEDFEANHWSITPLFRCERCGDGGRIAMQLMAPTLGPKTGR